MADLMDARTNRSQDYSFSRYLPLAAAGVHYLCRSDQRAAVTQPKKVLIRWGGGRGEFSCLWFGGAIGVAVHYSLF